MPSMRCRFAVPVAALLALAAAGKADAFCVYNKTNDADAQFYQQVPIRQIKALGKSFQTDLNAGKNGCCNWRNKDCNPDGQRDSAVEFQVHVSKGKYPYMECFTGSYDGIKGNQQTLPKIEAGGWLELINNPKFDASKKKYGSDNPPYLVLTYGVDGHSMGTFICPGYQADKPGLMDFF